jgi:VanZ family protein
MALSLLPTSDLPPIPLFRGADKIIHMTMYFFFSMVFCWALKAEMNYTRLFFIIPVTIGWGILMEAMQLEMHRGRSFSLFDMLANSIGVFAGVLIFVFLARKYST